MAINTGAISSALAALHPELTCSLKPWKDFAGHQLQRSAHVYHRHAAEVDHADHMGDASLFIFPEHYCPVQHLLARCKLRKTSHK